MSGDQGVYQKSMSSGHSAAWDQQWDTAASYYRQALAEFPDHPNALTSLGLALLETEDYEGSLRCYQRAAVVSPNDPIPFEKMARIYERQGKLQDAIRSGMQSAELYLKIRDVDKSIENWIHTLSLDPENIKAHTRLAMIYDRMGRKAEAVSEYLATAGLMQKAGDGEKSLQIVQYAIQIAPESQEARQALKMLKAGQPLPRPVRPRGGTGPMRMAQVRQLSSPKSDPQAAPQDPISEARQKALVQLASLLFDQEDQSPTDGQVNRRGLTALARGSGSLSLERAEQTRILLHVGQAIESQTRGEFSQAAEELNRAIEIGFSHPACYFNTGMLLLQSDRVQALRCLLKSVKHPDFMLASYILIGQIHLANQSYTEAADAYLQAFRLADIETVPEEQADELRQLYEPIIEAESRDTSVENLQNLCTTAANQLSRADWRSYLKMARAQMPDEGPDSPPMPLAEMLLQSRSSNVVEALASIRRLANQGKTRSAMEEAFHAIQYTPTYLPLHVQMGELLLKDNRSDEAVEKFTLVARLYSLRGEAEQAIKLLSRVTMLAPMDLTIRDRLIELLVSHGKIDEAVQEYIWLANTYYRLAELDLARKTYLAAMPLAQQSKNHGEWVVSILNKVADIDMQHLDWRQALRIFEQLRTIQPENVDARSRLIDLNFRLGQDNAALTELDSFTAYLDNNHKRQDAIQFLIDLITERPEKLDLRKRLAELYVRAKQIKQAVEQMDVIADSLINTGNRAGAIQMVKAIIALNPDNVNDYKAILEQLTKGTF